MLNHLTPASESDFEKEFNDFKIEAFRLECLQTYDIPEERESLASFLNAKNAKPPEDFIAEWRPIVGAATERGAVMRRLRIVVHPITDYLKFEIAWGYSHSSAFGEKISILAIDNFSQILWEGDFLKDFWLFDRTRCYVMDYDVRGRFLGIWRADLELTNILCKDKEALWRLAIPIEQSNFAAKLFHGPLN